MNSTVKRLLSELNRPAPAAAGQVEALKQVAQDMDLGALQQEINEFSRTAGAATDAVLDQVVEAAFEAGKAHPTEQDGDPTFPEDPVPPPGARPAAVVAFARVAAPNTSTNFDDLKDEYRELFDSCVIRDSKLSTVKWHRNKLLENRRRYEAVAAKFGSMPWWFVGIVHGLEASFDFRKHLHNGDPLTARTVRVPAGHPAAGNPPFTWEESAQDALALKRLDRINNWSLERCLYQFESFNGFGYRQRRGIHSPYLWSFSTHYARGKYTADGRYDPNAVSRQCGAAVMVRDLANAGIIDTGDGPAAVVASHRGQQYRVMAARLNVRSHGALEAPIIGTLDKDELVELLDDNSENYWLFVRRVEGGLESYASRKYLQPIVAGAVNDDEFPWMAIARGEIGVREISGAGAHNPRILEYLRSTTLGSPDNSRDETAWCSAFVNWCLERAGYAGTDSAWAKSWNNWGRGISRPRPGCIVVWDRDTHRADGSTGDGGHVGFFFSEDADSVTVLGGNQSNSVKEATYPKDGRVGSMDYKLLGYRIP
ncbi:MAG: TIGR02594 family protein [Gammaproteobacteria bacterium]